MTHTSTNKNIKAGRHTIARRSGFAALDEALYREKVLEARMMTPLEKLLLGEELFEYACEITLAGIRNQNPEFDEEDCQQELERRLQLAERMDPPL